MDSLRVKREKQACSVLVKQFNENKKKTGIERNL